MENRTRNRRVQVRLTDDEYDYLEYNVERTGLTKEAYLRLLIMDKIPKTIKDNEINHNIISQLYAIGNNLNQIARLGHSIKVINAERYDKNVADFKNIMNEYLESCQR